MSEEKKQQLLKPFYTEETEQVLAEVQTTEEGLTTAEAEKRLSEFGLNELEEGEKKSMFARFIEQFKDLMIIVLLFAAIISAVVSQDGVASVSS